MSVILDSIALDLSNENVKIINLMPPKIELFLEDLLNADVAEGKRFGIGISVAYPNINFKLASGVSKHETLTSAKKQYELLHHKMKKGNYKIYINSVGKLRLELN